VKIFVRHGGIVDAGERAERFIRKGAGDLIDGRRGTVDAWCGNQGVWAERNLSGRWRADAHVDGEGHLEQ